MTEQWLVGGITTSLGACTAIAAWQNAPWLFELRKVRWLQEVVGRDNARLFCGLGGCGLIAMGICIALGWLPQRGQLRAGTQRSESTLWPATE